MSESRAAFPTSSGQSAAACTSHVATPFVALLPARFLNLLALPLVVFFALFLVPSPAGRALADGAGVDADRHDEAEPAGAAGLPPVVFADGTGLPAGSGTARDGAPLYAARCASCHGASGEGGRAVELVGDPSLLRTDYPDRGIAVHWPYAPPLYDYIRRAMPPDAPWSLDADETYAVVAHVLALNALVGPDRRVDAAFLGSLRMPNVSGFERAPD